MVFGLDTATIRLAVPLIILAGLAIGNWLLDDNDSNSSSGGSSSGSSGGGFLGGVVSGVMGAVSGLIMAIVALPRRAGAWVAGILMGLWSRLTGSVPSLSGLAKNPIVLIFVGLIFAGVFARFGELGLFGAFDFIALVVALLIWVYFVLRRFGFFDWRLYVGIALVAFLFGGELIRPGSLLPKIGDAIASVAPLAGIMLLYFIYDWWQSRKEQDRTSRVRRGARRVRNRRRRGNS